MNLGAQLSKRALLNSDAEALVDLGYDEPGGRRFTFAELNARSDRAGHSLTGLGLAKGDRVAVLLPTGHQFVEVFYGAAKAGLIVVPLNWRLVAHELAFLLRDSGATVLVFDAAYDAAVAELHDGDATDVAHWVRVGDDQPAWTENYESLVERAPADPVTVDADGDDPVFIMYTSGTTGQPKGAVHTHDSVQWALVDLTATIDLRIRDRWLMATPMFHVAALGPLVWCVYRGATVVMMRDFDPVQVWEVFRDERITNAIAVPAMLNVMLPTYRPELRESLVLRWIATGAAPVPVSLLESYLALGFEIHQIYGLTESHGIGCAISSEDAVERRAPPASRTSTPRHASSMPTAPMSGPASPAKCCCAGATSWPATGTGRKPLRRRSSTAGCTPAISRCATPTGSSTSRTGSRT